MNYLLDKKVFALAPDEEVSCYFCIEDGEHATYRRGEAVLAGADHPPYDANANYVCMNHLCPEYEVCDLYGSVAGAALSGEPTNG